MLSVRRQVALDYLLELPALLDGFGTGSLGEDGVLNWLASLAAALGRIRSPLAARVGAQRALVVAVRSGYREPSIEPGVSARRAVKGTIAVVLARVESDLRDEVQRIDDQLLPLREKMLQLVAVGSSHVALPLPSTVPREQWLGDIWGLLAGVESTRSLHSYLGAALSRVDRLWLLDDLMRNLLQD